MTLALQAVASMLILASFSAPQATGPEAVREEIGRKVDVVFDFKAVLYPGHIPSFKLVAENGSAYSLKLHDYWENRFIYQDPFLDETEDSNSGWIQCKIRDVPEGVYTFEAYSNKSQILQLPGIEVKQMPPRCYPKQLRLLELEEQNLVRIGFEFPKGGRVQVGPYGERFFRILKQEAKGFTVNPKFICERHWLCFAKGTLSKDYTLLLPGFHPIPLQGIEDGDIIALEELPYVLYSVEVGGNWPANCYLSPFVMPKGDENSLLFHQVSLNFMFWNPFDGFRVHFPVEGDYEIRWSLLVGYEQWDEESWKYGLPGQTLHFDHSLAGKTLELTVPDSVKVQAWIRHVEARYAGPPIIEMTPLPPPEEDPLPPPPSGQEVEKTIERNQAPEGG